MRGAYFCVMTVRRTASSPLAAGLLATGLLAAGLAAAAVTGAAPAAAAPAAGGHTVTGPAPVPAPDFDLAAGDVCAFGVHGTYPVNRQQGWTTTDASGRTVAEYVQGTLTGVFTNTATGRSVTRDLSGQGLSTYAADGSSVFTGHGPALVGFHAGDRPAHQLLVFGSRGVEQVRFAADGRRTLVVGAGEDLCRTLA